MGQILSIIQVVLAIILIAAILVQQRGSGLGMAFGGGGEVYSVRRGAEKFLFIATILISVLFFVVGILRIFLESQM